MSRTRIIGAVAVVAVLVTAIVLLRRQPDKLAALPPTGVDNSTLRVGRHLFQIGKASPLVGTLDIFTDGKLVQHISGANFAVKDFGDEPEGWTNGSDINADSIPEVLVREDTGGAHCCTSWRIFHAGDTVELLYQFDNGHTDFFPLVDVDEDAYGLQVFDWTFAYWKTSFASSPAMRLIYWWQNGRYEFSPELTRLEPASETDLRRKAAELNWTSGGPEAVPAQFWSEMLELIVTGNADQLPLYTKLAWPADRPGQDEFMAEFAQQLRRSKHWAEIEAVNDGQLEAALPK